MNADAGVASRCRAATCSRSTARRSRSRAGRCWSTRAAARSPRVSDDGTASPMVGPDGDVYFGVLETAFGTHNARGWLLHFDATLPPARRPAASAGTTRASIVPASMVPSYAGTVDLPADGQVQQLPRRRHRRRRQPARGARPARDQADAISGLPVMREVLTHPRPDASRRATPDRSMRVVHQHGRGRPADQLGAGQQRGRLSLSLGPRQPTR